MKEISVERLLVESSKLHDHRQPISCVIRNVTVESVGSSGLRQRLKTNVDKSERSSPILQNAPNGQL